MSAARSADVLTEEDFLNHLFLPNDDVGVLRTNLQSYLLEDFDANGEVPVYFAYLFQCR